MSKFNWRMNIWSEDEKLCVLDTTEKFIPYPGLHIQIRDKVYAKVDLVVYHKYHDYFGVSLSWVDKTLDSKELYEWTVIKMENNG